MLNGRFLVEKAEQVKTASIISAEGDTEAADLLASAFAKAGEGLVSIILFLLIQHSNFLGSYNKNIKKLPLFYLENCAVRPLINRNL